MDEQVVVIGAGPAGLAAAWAMGRAGLDGSACSPDVVICATGYRPALGPLAGHLVALDGHGMPPFTGPSPSPRHPGLWFFGLDRSIYGNMHIHRPQARRLAQMIAGHRGLNSSAR